MTFATSNWVIPRLGRTLSPKAPRLDRLGEAAPPETEALSDWPPNRNWGARISSVAGVAAGLTMMALMAPPTAEADPVSDARREFWQAHAQFNRRPQEVQPAWQFGRACFDLAEFATNSTERAELAQQGVAACRQAAAQESRCAPAHYHLALNLGQLARTRGLGALKLVNQMETELIAAHDLDETLDNAGPDRALGLLYRDAPAIASVGSRSKARQHLERAAALAPDYPDNGLNLIETFLQWNDRNGARRAFKTLEQALPAARAKFSSPQWVSSWTDWDARLQKASKRLEEPARLQTPRH
jgi:hypothetical protein